MSNVIVRAQKEVFLATNYWQNGIASKFITNAMKELSRRAGERGDKIIMKIIYDRGNPKQLLEPHYNVGEKEYTGKNVGLPHPSEIPNIDLQVINYHQPMLGTFHAKYMVVDRNIAILQSNNIQDNDNVEMMVHLEGPIVDSLYDMALISWHKALDPVLPSYNSPAARGGLGSFGERHTAMFTSGATLRGSSVVMDTSKMTPRQAYGRDGSPIHQPGAVDPSVDGPSDYKHRTDIVTGPTTTHSVTHPHPDSGPDKVVNGHEEHGNLVNGSTKDIQNGASDLVAEKFLGGGDQVIPQSQIQEPSRQDHPLPEHMTDDPHYDDDIAGEVARVQTAVSPKTDMTRMRAVTKHLNHTTNEGFEGSAPECPTGEEMTPYIPHPAHEPFPIAMVCRPPYGPPNHKSVSNPQNAAWLSALRNAQKNIFIQSPTLNAAPLVPAIIAACERGIDVYCYICLGYNDTVRISRPLASCTC
jgi:hypothetical protein